MNFPIPTLIVDILAVAILVIFAIRGRKRGLIKTVAGILALVLAFWGASFLAEQTTPYLSEKYVEPWLYDSIMPEISTGTEPAAPPATEAAATDSIGNALSSIGFSDSFISSFFSDFAISLSDSMSQITSNVSQTLGSKITYAVLFIVFFLVLYLLFRLLANLINLLAKIPGINFVNRTLGLILGLIFGFLTILVLSYILTKIGILSPEQISDTYVLRFLLSISPLA